MSDTPNLGLPEVAQGSSQPHVPINTSFRILDIVTQLIVKTMNLTAPPGSPAAGDAHIVAGEGGTATGVWADHENEIAFYNSGWQFITPKLSWITYVEDEGSRFEFRSDVSPDAWVPYIGPSGLSVSNDDSPPDIVSGVTELVFEDAAVTELTGGVARVRIFGSGDTPNIGGSLMAVGDVLSDTATVPGAIVGMVAVCAPATYPGDGFIWSAQVTGADTVTVRLSALIVGTPAASIYNVRTIS